MPKSLQTGLWHRSDLCVLLLEGRGVWSAACADNPIWSARLDPLAGLCLAPRWLCCPTAAGRVPKTQAVDCSLSPRNQYYSRTEGNYAIDLWSCRGLNAKFNTSSNSNSTCLGNMEWFSSYLQSLQTSMIQVKWSFCALGAITFLVYPGLIFQLITVTQSGTEAPEGL